MKPDPREKVRCCGACSRWRSRFMKSLKNSSKGEPGGNWGKGG